MSLWDGIVDTFPENLFGNDFDEREDIFVDEILSKLAMKREICLPYRNDFWEMNLTSYLCSLSEYIQQIDGDSDNLDLQRSIDESDRLRSLRDQVELISKVLELRQQDGL